MFCNYVIVCNQVVVSTKSPKSDKQYVWEAVADSSSYVIREETDPEKLLQRGTQITLYLRVCNLIYLFYHTTFQNSSHGLVGTAKKLRIWMNMLIAARLLYFLCYKLHKSFVFPLL